MVVYGLDLDEGSKPNDVIDVELHVVEPQNVSLLVDDDVALQRRVEDLVGVPVVRQRSEVHFRALRAGLVLTVIVDQAVLDVAATQLQPAPCGSVVDVCLRVQPLLLCTKLLQESQHALRLSSPCLELDVQVSHAPDCATPGCAHRLMPSGQVGRPERASTLAAMPRTARAALLLALIVGVATLAAYFIGRTACPPPGWWLTLFARDGNFGCVA